MSGIAGALHFDDAPVDARTIRAMTDAARHRGPDTGGCWVEGGVGLGHRMLVSTPQALAERQPLHDAQARLCLVFDGRVDNRDELARELRAAGRPPRDESDAGLVLRAYEKWGEACARKILGDFAFALWDGGRRQLYCARDILGLRPFHYHCAPRAFLFGSEAKQLFCDARVPGTLNEGLIGEYLACAIASLDETFFSGIRRLPPGHALTVGADGRMTLRRYWSLREQAPIRYAREEQYAEHLVQLIERSIACRLRAEGAVGASLSGGLDSSTVAVVAAQLAAQNARGFAAYGVSYDGLPCDESDYIRLVAAHAGLELHLQPCRELENREYADFAERHLAFPGYPMANSQLGTFFQSARGRRARVLLSGAGSDELFSGNADQLADMLAALQLARSWREARGIAEVSRISVARALYRHGVKPWLRRARTALRLRAEPPHLPWISARWAGRIALFERIQPALSDSPPLADTPLSAHDTHFLEMSDLLGADAGIDYRHPMLDRRLLEFVEGIPADLHFRHGRRKHLLRMAMRTRLPEKTLSPGTNADFTAINVRALDRVLAAAPLHAWPVARAGWIDAEQLLARYRRARDEIAAGRNWSRQAIWDTWMAYGAGVLLEASPRRSMPL